MRASPLLSLLSIVVVGLGHVCRAIGKIVRIVPTRGRRPDLPSPLSHHDLILSFTAPTGNSIGLAKIVVYMPICLFDLCKMAVPPAPLTHTYTHSPSPCLMCALRFGQTIPGTSELAATPESSQSSPSLLVCPLCPAWSRKRY